jgi:RNA-directed DNA polymerase
VKSDAEQFWAELTERFRKFALELHAVKERLLEFGPFAVASPKRRGEGKPDTFNFLDCTHSCSKTKAGRYTVRRQTTRKWLQAKAKLHEAKTELRRGIHDPIPKVGAWLRTVDSGRIRYFRVPMNGPALNAFRSQVDWVWHRVLLPRSQQSNAG